MGQLGQRSVWRGKDWKRLEQAEVSNRRDGEDMSGGGWKKMAAPPAPLSQPQMNLMLSWAFISESEFWNLAVAQEKATWPMSSPFHLLPWSIRPGRGSEGTRKSEREKISGSTSQNIPDGSGFYSRWMKGPWRAVAERGWYLNIRFKSTTLRCVKSRPCSHIQVV